MWIIRLYKNIKFYLLYLETDKLDGSHTGVLAALARVEPLAVISVLALYMHMVWFNKLLSNLESRSLCILPIVKNQRI